MSQGNQHFGTLPGAAADQIDATVFRYHEISLRAGSGGDVTGQGRLDAGMQLPAAVALGGSHAYEAFTTLGHGRAF